MKTPAPARIALPWLALGLAALLAGGCLMPTAFPSSLPRFPAGTMPEVEVGEPFVLGHGETVRVPDAGIFVNFIYVPQDGRCPHGVECAATNPVHVKLLVRDFVPGMERTLDLSAHTDGDGTVTAGAPGVSPAAAYGDWDVRLLAVTPHPDARREIPRKGYSVQLVVLPAGAPAPGVATD
jgi:hypothetical protein